jgi:AcrR family transcriptional regulator
MERSSTRRTQEQRRTETRRRVLEAAIELIAKHGSRAISLAEVGRAAGYSRGIVTHHFGTRSELLRTAVVQAQLFDVPDNGGSGLERLDALVRTYLAGLRDRAPACQAFLILWTEALASDPVLAPLYAQRDSWFRAILADLVRKGLVDGSIRPDADPSAVAATLLGLLRGIGLQSMSVGAPVDVDAVIEQTVHLVSRGLAPR